MGAISGDRLVIDLTVGLLVALGAAAITNFVVHNYYGVLNATIMQDSIAGGGLLSIAWASSFLSNFNR